MLATLSEYITLDAKIVEQVLTDRAIPEYWKQVWLTYISVKPIKPDAKSLLSAYVRAFRYGAVAKDELDNFVKSLKQYGFTDREIDFISKRVELEERILATREYIPTPSMLATLCEYLPEAREFFDDVVKAKRIPKDWQELWAKYIDIKPLVDDIKRYLARAEDLYVRFMIKKDDFEKILNDVAKQLGYTPKEIEFLKKVTEFERYKNAWTELIGTVNRLVELSEYSPTASEWALGKLNAMIDALPLSDDEKKMLKTMWEEYIRNRPVKSEAKMYITQLINAYVDGILSETDFDKELQSMKKWGFSDTEIQFYKQIATVRKARKLRIPLVYGE
jgi:chemotaxis regulatin CheY-phosphate phosphatase CheZ